MTARVLVASAALVALLEVFSSSSVQEARSSDARTAASVRPEQHPDAGVRAAPPSDEDREVLENLELLQHLDDWRDLDVLLELSKSS